MNRAAAKDLLNDMILNTTDVTEVLLINRSRVKALVEAGKITPLKVLKNDSLFWLPDVVALKKELLKDSRSNLFKLQYK